MKYKIYLREVIEPVGQEEWTELYDTQVEAWNRIHEVNGRKYGVDWYLQAKEVVETVEIDKNFPQIRFDLPFEKV